MNIKQSIFALSVFFGVSFSASAETVYQYTPPNAWYAENYPTCSGSFTGTQQAAISRCVGSTFDNITITSCRHSGGNFRCDYSYSSGGSSSLNFATYYASSCPAGTELIDGECKEPEPTCEDGQIYNPETGQCEVDDFCQSDEYLNLKVDANIACINQYPDWYTKFIPSCTDSNNYSFECAQLMPRPTDPTDEIDSPDSGFTGGSGGTANPAPPSFDKPEPDDVTPEDSTDTAVLSAIQNMNRDNNQAFTGLNTDVNQGFADVNNQLSQLNDTNNAIGQTIVDQMNQDYQIYQGQKALMLQQSGYISQGSADIVNAVGGQTSELKGALTGLGAGIDAGLDGLGSKIDGLGEKLGEIGAPCDPNEDARNCEGEHGLTHDTAKDVTNQIDAAVSGQFDEAESAILDSTNQFTDGSFVSSVQVYLDDTVNLALGAMPNIGDCTPFSMPSPFGGTIDFGCEFSVKFKSIASFLLYVYTIWTLLDILFEGVTPVPGTVPHRSRGI